MSTSRQEPARYPLSSDLQKTLAEARKEFPDIKSIPNPKDTTYKFYTLAPMIVKELEKEYQKITSATSSQNHSYSVVLFHGESILGTDYSSILVPVAVQGHPRVKGLEDVNWDGSELLYISGKIVLNLAEDDRLGAWVVSFPKA